MTSNEFHNDDAIGLGVSIGKYPADPEDVTTHRSAPRWRDSAWVRIAPIAVVSVVALLLMLNHNDDRSGNSSQVGYSSDTATTSNLNDPTALANALYQRMDAAASTSVGLAPIRLVSCMSTGDHNFACTATTIDGRSMPASVVVTDDGTDYQVTSQ